MAGAGQNKPKKKVDRSLKPASIARIVELAQKHCTAAEWGQVLRIPLKYAAGGGDKELTKELVRAGASGDPISEAIRGGQYDVIKHLGQKPRTNHLQLAVDLGSEAMVSFLLGLGADADQPIRMWGIEMPLAVAAAREGQAGIVGLLLDAGADASRRATNDELVMSEEEYYNEHGDTLHFEPEYHAVETVSALDMAAVEGHVDVIEEITRREPSVVNSVAESTGETALHWAVKHGQVGSIDALVEAGADLQAGCGRATGTALHVAAESPKRESTLLALLRNGAHVDSSRGDGYATPLCVAVAAGNRVAVDALLSAGADLDIALLVSSANRYMPSGTVFTLLERGADVNTRRASDGNTPLHLAAMTTSSFLVDVLLKAGSDETAANGKGETPLDVVGRDANWNTGGRNAVRSLLVNAPRDRADRAWSRRKFFVLCHAFPSRVRLGLALPENRDVEGCSPTNSASEAPTTSGNSSEKPTSGDQKDDEEQCFPTAMGRLMAVEADIVFRTIVEFL